MVICYTEECFNQEFNQKNERFFDSGITGEDRGVFNQKSPILKFGGGFFG